MSITATDYTLADRIESGLRKCVGKANACRTSVMIRKLKKEDIKVSGAKIREIIHYLRTVRKMFICGDEHGYYVPLDDTEKTHEINSLNSRIKKITAVRDALVEIRNGKIKQQEMFN